MNEKQMGPIRKLITISEAADLCRVTAETIRRWVDQGAITCTRTLGGHRRIDLEDFKGFLKTQNMAKGISLEADKDKVLVIGRDRERAQVLSKSIRAVRPEMKVVLAGCCFEAGWILASQTPCLVFLLDGIETRELMSTMRAIRDDVRTRQASLVMVGRGNGPTRKAGADRAMRDPSDTGRIEELFGDLEI